MILDQEDVVESGAAFAPLHVHNALDSNVSVKSMGPIFAHIPTTCQSYCPLKMDPTKQYSLGCILVEC